MVVVFLARVKKYNETDRQKLVRIINYLNGIRKYLTPSADNLKVIQWYVDAIFAVHPDLKIHTGVIITMGQR